MPTWTETEDESVDSENDAESRRIDQQPGWYDCEVFQVRQSENAKGERIGLGFREISSQKIVGWDNLFFYDNSFAGKIAHKKAEILGIEIKKLGGGKYDFDHEDLELTRAKIYWDWEISSDKNYDDKWCPKFKKSGTQFGYKSLMAPVPMSEGTPKKEDKTTGDIPF
tara:strand:+ start:386 stop:886 length:501 start_codon:yes stop_codon:yes gene_type:complete